MTSFTQADIEAALKRDPDLGFDGYASHTSAAARTEQRQKLRAAWRLVRDCALLLSAADPSHGSLHSYTLKHRLEHRFETLGHARYVSNGVAILAARLVGLRVRRIEGPNAVFDAHHAFLGGRTAGLAYRVRHTEAELAEVASLVDRVARRDRQGRGASPSHLVGPTEPIEPIEAALRRSELVVGSEGRYIMTPYTNGLSRLWSVRAAQDLRPVQHALILSLRDLEDELDATITAARETLAHLSPEEAARPTPEAFATAARAVEASLAELTEAFRHLT